jgi:hypothetical protein
MSIAGMYSIQVTLQGLVALLLREMITTTVLPYSQRSHLIILLTRLEVSQNRLEPPSLQDSQGQAEKAYHDLTFPPPDIPAPVHTAVVE